VSWGTRGPKKNPPFLGQPGQLHSLFKAAHACTDLFCLSCVVYSYTWTFIVAICPPSPSQKKNQKKLYIQAFWTATYKIQSWTHFILLYLDPWTKIRQIHWFLFLPGSASQKLFFDIQGSWTVKYMIQRCTYSILPYLSSTIKKIGKFIFARVCSPEIVPLCPGCKGHIFSFFWNQ